MPPLTSFSKHDMAEMLVERIKGEAAEADRLRTLLGDTVDDLQRIHDELDRALTIHGYRGTVAPILRRAMQTCRDAAQAAGRPIKPTANSG